MTIYMSSPWVIDLVTSECMSGDYSLYSEFDIIYNAYSALVLILS